METFLKDKFILQHQLTQSQKTTMTSATARTEKPFKVASLLSSYFLSAIAFYQHDSKKPSLFAPWIPSCVATAMTRFKFDFPLGISVFFPTGINAIIYCKKAILPTNSVTPCICWNVNWCEYDGTGRSIPSVYVGLQTPEHRSLSLIWALAQKNRDRFSCL